MSQCESPRCELDATTARRGTKLCLEHARWVDVCFPSDGALRAEFEARLATLYRETQDKLRAALIGELSTLAELSAEVGGGVFEVEIEDEDGGTCTS